jgi:hypothetical protein
VLDPNNDGSRDEGEIRLRVVRDVLGRAVWVSDDAVGLKGLGAIFQEMTEDEPCNQATTRSIVDPFSTNKPKARLMQPTCTVTKSSNNKSKGTSVRSQPIPVKKEKLGLVANFMAPQEQEEQTTCRRRLTMDFDPSCTGSATTNVTILEKDSALCVKVKCTRGPTKTFLSERISVLDLKRLFGWPTSNDRAAAVRAVPRLLPIKKGEIPEALMIQLAHFWKDCMRFQILTEHIAPGQPLAFETFFLRESPKTGHVEVCGTLHASSATCLCELHGGHPIKKSYPGVKFERSEVELVLTMCGKSLSSIDELCEVHGPTTPNAPDIPGTCCANFGAWAGCFHQKARGAKDAARRERGKLMPNLFIPRGARMRARVLIAAVVKCCNLCNDAKEKYAAPEDDKKYEKMVTKICQHVVTKTEEKLETLLSKRGSKRGVAAAELKERDVCALDLLQQTDGTVYQHVKHVKGTEQMTLSWRDTNSNATGKKRNAEIETMKKKATRIADTHAALFRPYA